MTPGEAAQALGMDAETLRRWADGGAAEFRAISKWPPAFFASEIKIYATFALLLALIRPRASDVLNCSTAAAEPSQSVAGLSSIQPRCSPQA